MKDLLVLTWKACQRRGAVSKLFHVSLVSYRKRLQTEALVVMVVTVLVMAVQRCVFI